MTFTEETKALIKPIYTTDLSESFYKPLLKDATLYRRVSGYFSAAGIDLYADGLEELAKNDGRVHFIISKEISREDFAKIKEGYDLLEELKPLRVSERNESLNAEKQKKLGNLAFMIAIGKARVKVALTEKGLFHDKFGIISSENEHVFFNGSVNETRGGIDTNYESISVDVSWDQSKNVKKRINESIERFDRLWNNTEDRVTVIEASEVLYEEIARFQESASLNMVAKKINRTVNDEHVLEEFDAEIIVFKLISERIVRVDKTKKKITSNDRKLRPGSDINTYFEDDNCTIKSSVGYREIERIIEVTTARANRLNVTVVVTDAVSDYIAQNKYSIMHYRILGDIFKGELNRFPESKYAAYCEFSKIVQEEVTRPLHELHLRAAFFEYEMSRAANFSVPGSGKTSMVLGVFAYLNRIGANPAEYVKRILVISPINAFDSWKQEFYNVFKDKKKLKCIDTQTSKDFMYDLDVFWGSSNLVLVNYESLPKHTNKLKILVDKNTLLVFDEVHRIKNPQGKRAEKALEITQKPKFKFVLTGTPIPNSYKDIYNFLHILYGAEYNSFFGWNPEELESPKYGLINEINKKISPFFWRTNKYDLNIPEAESDNLIVVAPTQEQLDLADAIYKNEPSNFARLIRLIQASTNPSLIKNDINYKEIMAYDESGEISGLSESEFNRLLDIHKSSTTIKSYSEFNLDSMISPKFKRGIELVSSLVDEGKKVLVWGIFVDTLHKISNALIAKGYKVNLIYGATEKNMRTTLINEFKDKDVQVLVSNPQTLGESISLHKSVHDAVYFEYDFNLTFMLQSKDRIHRLGLTKNEYTRYYYLQTKAEDFQSYRAGYIDEKIYNRLIDKAQIMYDAIDNNKLHIEYTENEILEAIKIIEEERRRIAKSNR